MNNHICKDKLSSQKKLWNISKMKLVGRILIKMLNKVKFKVQELLIYCHCQIVW